jgi:hypothetical protein
MTATQAELQSGQSNLKWGGGILITAFIAMVSILIAVVVVDINRAFTLGDRVADTQATSQRTESLLNTTRQDVIEIKSDVKSVQRDSSTIPSLQHDINELRLQTQEISHAVGAHPVPKPEVPQTPQQP